MPKTIKSILFFFTLLLLPAIALATAGPTSAQGTCGCQTVYVGYIPIACTPYWDLCTKPNYSPSCQSAFNICYGDPNCFCTYQPPPTPTPTLIPIPTCIPNSYSCAGYPNKCCSGYCNPSNPQICMFVPTSTPIPTAIPSCTGTYLSCSYSAQCCSGFCDPSSRICLPLGPTTAPCCENNNPTGTFCHIFDYPSCIGDPANCYWTCAVPPPTCIPLGAPCDLVPNGPNCCSRYCANKVCIPYPTVSVPGAPSPVPPKVFCDSSGKPTSEYNKNNPPPYIFTSLGCVPYKPVDFAGAILSWALGIFAGLAFLILLYAAFNIATAQGDPKKIQAGKELIVAALSGLALIATAIVVLNFLGVKVLNLGLLGFDVK